MRNLTMAVAILLGVAAFTGCTNKKDASEGSDTEEMSEDNPFAAYAGDWLTEVYSMEGGEPLVVVLVKGTDNTQGWSMKFTHMDEAVPATNVFMKDDSLVMAVGSYPSALRDGATVESVTSYLHAHGDAMSGRFVAVYEGGDVLRGTMSAERVK